MPSKWAFLKTHFPTWQGDNPTYNEALDAFTERYRTKDLAELAHLVNDMESKLAEYEDYVRELKLEIEAVSRAMGDKMDNAGLDSIVTAGFRWSPSYEPYPHVTDRQALRAWADAHMSDNLALPWQTLRAVVKDALDPDAGDLKLPPGVQVYVKRSFRRTKQS